MLGSVAVYLVWDWSRREKPTARNYQLLAFVAGAFILYIEEVEYWHDHYCDDFNGQSLIFTRLLNAFLVE